MENMLSTVLDHKAVDDAVKLDDLERYKQWIWTEGFRNGSCSKVLGATYHGFDISDAAKVANWSGLPCT